MVSLQDLVKARVHFGHRTSRWCPKMAPYIWGEKNGIHLIDIAKTAALLEQAAQFLRGCAAEGKRILWVGTKGAAQGIIEQAAETVKDPYVSHRWIGGTLTNFPQVRKSVTKLLHLEDVIQKSDQFSYTKKELNKFQKNVGRLRSNVGGISTLQWPVGALIVVDVRKEKAAIREAISAGVPVVAIADTDVDPTGIDRIIPANDDAKSSIEFIINYLKDAVALGKSEMKERPKAAEAELVAVAQVTEEVVVEEGAEKTEDTVRSKPAPKKRTATRAKSTTTESE